LADDDRTGASGRPLRKQGEEAIGKFAQELLQNPMVSGALTTVFETRERATRAQEVAMSALNLPSAADIERLTRRVRSVSQRIEGLEDSLDRLGDKLDAAGAAVSLEARLSGIEAALARIEARLADPPAGS
jgi:predicted  nucleic acid-binding Zn-ribbon protein